MGQKKRQEILQDFLYHYAVTLIVFSVATAINYLIVMLYGKDINVSGIYMLAVILISLLTGSYFWGMLGAIGSVVGTNFCFTYPYFAIDFSLSGYPLTFLIMAIVAICSCAVAVNMRKQRDQANRREQIVYTLNEMDGKLVPMESKGQIVSLLLDYLYVHLERPVFYLEYKGDELVCIGNRGEMQDHMTALHYETVQLSFVEKRIAGRGVDEENSEGFLSIPMLWQERIFGAVCIWLGAGILSAEKRSYAQGLVNHFAIAFARQELSEQQQEILMEKQAEQTRGYLLRAISHDLRTPLTGILGASGALLENGPQMPADLAQRLLQDIHEEAQWLLRMIENVLSVTKIGNYNPELKKTLEPVEEVIADSVARCKKYFPDLMIEIHLPEELIMLPMDPILIRQVVTNLIDNAYRHGNSKEKIELTVCMEQGYVAFSVRDYGPGLSLEEQKHLFHGYNGKQKRNGGDAGRGLGLGTSICKTIVEAHNGQIFAETPPGKGLRVVFRLPIEEKSDL